MKLKRSINIILIVTLVGIIHSGCSTMKSVLAIDDKPKNTAPIQNPFGYVGTQLNGHDTIVLRTKKGDRSVEVELPANHGTISDFVVPVSPAFKENGGRDIASTSNNGIVDERYRERTAGVADREIASSLPKGTTDTDPRRHEIEQGLGVVPNMDEPEVSDQSYLASVDHVKQLYRNGRFEAALLETDELVRSYPTDPKIYEMRGTLFDRIGQADLAIKAWNQSLRLNPNNAGLKKFVERKTQKRGVATQ